MRNVKFTRGQKLGLMSKCTSISETLIATVSEQTKHSEKEVAEAFEQSEINKKLFNFSTGYHEKDAIDLAIEFIKECEVKYGWKSV